MAPWTTDLPRFPLLEGRRRCSRCRGSRPRSAERPRCGSSARTSSRSRSVATSCGTSSSSSARPSPMAPTPSSRPAAAGRTMPGSPPRPGLGPGSPSTRPLRPTATDRPRARASGSTSCSGRPSTGRHGRPRRARGGARGGRGRLRGRRRPAASSASAVRASSARSARSWPGFEVVDHWRARGASAGRPSSLPSATGGTQAGLLVGLRRPAPRRGPRDRRRRPAEELRPKIVGLVAALGSVDGLARVPDVEVLLDGDQLGDGYGRRTEAADEATGAPRPDRGDPRRPDLHREGPGRLIARRPGRAPRGRRVVFWHAGGTPGLFEPLGDSYSPADRQASRSLIRPPVCRTAPAYTRAPIVNRTQIADDRDDRRQDDLPRRDRIEGGPERDDERRGRRDERRDRAPRARSGR